MRVTPSTAASPRSTPGAGSLSPLVRRHFGAAGAAATVLFFAASGVSATAPNELRCRAAHESAKERERTGHLREAKEFLLACARSTCGRALRRACAAEVTQLDTVDLPSVVPAVTDDAGAPMADVQLTMDGELLASRLDGQPIAVDPGLHEFSFATKGQVFATQKIMVVQGQQGRPLSASLRSPDSAPKTEKAVAPVSLEPPPAPAPPSTGKTALPFVLGAAAVAGAEAVTLGALLGRGETLSAAANVGIGVSVGIGAAALVATVWAFAHPRSADQAPSGPTLRLAVQPAPSGAVAGVAGSF